MKLLQVIYDLVHDNAEVFILLAVLVIAAALPYVMVSYDCKVYEQTTLRDTEMKGMTCYVKHETGFLPMEEYLAVVASRRN